MTTLQLPKTAPEIVLWLVDQAKHSDNMSEFASGPLAEAWRLAGLPGDLPVDPYGFIDTPDPKAQADEYRALASAFGAVDGLRLDSEWVHVQPAVFVSLERSSDVGRIEDAAHAAGLEAYPFRREIVVALPVGGRPSVQLAADVPAPIATRHSASLSAR